MLSERRKSAAYKLFAFVCVLVLSIGMFHTGALADFSASTLNGRWACFYAYDEAHGREIKDKMYYTFYDISDIEGKYKFENRTKGTTTYGTFVLAEGYLGEGYDLRLYENGFIDIYETEDLWMYISLAFSDTRTFTLSLEGDYYALYKKE